MARLLAAQRDAALDHLLHHVLVADRTPHEADTRLAARDLEADVAHHGRHDRVAAQPTLALQLARTHQQDGVAVDDLAAVVHEDGAVAVAIEGHAHVAAAFDDGAREPLGMRRSAVAVDVASVGLVRDDDGIEAEAREEPGRHKARRAVGAIDGELEIAERRRLREHGAQMIQIRAGALLRRDGAAPRPAAAFHDGSATIASTARSTDSVNFSPRPENTLMPLSSNGLCDAEITMPASYPERVRYAMAGVGTTPALVTTAPSPEAPCASSASIHPPDSRVSRPTSSRGAAPAALSPLVCGSARTSEAPSRRTVGGSRGYCPAAPRTPSVPNNRGGGIRSVFGTGDADLDRCRIDMGHASLIRGGGVHGEHVVAGPEARDIDVGVTASSSSRDSDSRLPRRPTSTTTGIACAERCAPRFRR